MSAMIRAFFDELRGDHVSEAEADQNKNNGDGGEDPESSVCVEPSDESKGHHSDSCRAASHERRSDGLKEDPDGTRIRLHRLIDEGSFASIPCKSSSGTQGVTRGEGKAEK